MDILLTVMSCWIADINQTREMMSRRVTDACDVTLESSYLCLAATMVIEEIYKLEAHARARVSVRGQ